MQHTFSWIEISILFIQWRYLKARELFYAMKTLGFSITPKLTEEYIEAEALDANLK
jgi:hypothetical protein